MTAYEQSISRLEKMRFAFCNDFLGGPVGVDHKDKMSLTVDLGTMTMTTENNNHHHRQARASLFTLHFVPKYHAFHIEFNSVFGVGTHRRNYSTRTTSPTQQQQRRRSPSPPQSQQQKQRHRQSLVTSSVSSSRPQTVNCNNSNSLGMTNAMLTAVSTSGTFYNTNKSQTSPSSKNIQNNNKHQEKQQQQQRLVWTIEDDVQEQEEEQNNTSSEHQQKLHSPTPPQSSSSKPGPPRGRRFSSPIAHSMSIRRDLVREKKNMSDSAMNFNSARSKIVNKRIVLRPVVEMNDDEDGNDEEKEQAFLRQLFVLQPLYGGIPLGSDHAASAALLGVDKMTLSRSQRYEITPFLTSTAVVEVSIQKNTKNKNTKDQQEDEEKSKTDNDQNNKNKKKSPPGTAASSSSPRSRSRSRSPLQNHTSIQQQQQQGADVVSLYLRARREVPTSHSIFAVTRDVRCIRTEQFQNIPRIGYHLDDDKKKREKMMKKNEDESNQNKNDNDEDEDQDEYKKNQQQQIQEEQKEKDEALARLEQQQQQMKRFKKERKRLQKHEAEERNVIDFEHEATSFSLLMTAFANERHEILEREMIKNEHQTRIEDVADESVLRAQMKKLERVQHSNLSNNNGNNNTTGNSDENTNNTTPQQHPIFPSSSNNVDQQTTPNASPNKNNQNNSAATSEASPSAIQQQSSFASVGGFGERLPSLVLSEQDVSQMSPEQRSLWTKRQSEISAYQQQLQQQQQQSGDQSSQNQNQQQQQPQPLSLQQSTSGGSYTLRESPQHDDAEY